jgi:DNA polymerase III subunit gamma/tau
MSAAGVSSNIGLADMLRSDAARSSISGASAAVAVAEAPEVAASESAPEPVTIETLRSALVGVLEAQGQDTAADLLARGEWKLDGNQLNLRLPLSEKVIDLSLSADSRRLLTQEASRVCGRVMKLNVSGGGTAQDVPLERTNGNGHANGNGSGNGAGSARQRAAEDPIVRRMQEKFGAEVRTVVDLKKR